MLKVTFHTQFLWNFTYVICLDPRYSDSLRAERSGDRIPVGARFSAPVQTGPGAHPASYTRGTGSFPGVKRPGRGVDHLLPPNAEVKERVELYLYPPSGPSWPVLWLPLPLPHWSWFQFLKHKWIIKGITLQVRGSNRGGGEIFRTCPDRPWGPPSLLYNGYRVFPGGKERPGRDADPSPPSSAVVKKEQSYTSTPPMGRTACTEPQCLYKSALYFGFSPSLLLH